MILTDEELWINLGVIGLATVSFIEAIFFPLPPDAILVPLVLTDKSNALFYALVATVFSALGGIVGYYIGKKAGEKILLKIIKKDHAASAKRVYKKHGALAVFISSFTPIPYKVFTILSGVLGLDLKVMFIVSLFGRGLRFFAESIVVSLLGKDVIHVLTSNIEMATIVIGTIIVIVYVATSYIKKVL